MQYMRAHGNTPGPTQRPVTAGAMTGTLAAFPAALIFWFTNAWEGIAHATGVQVWLAFPTLFVFAALAGALYGRVFSRAANDRQGGWLFGAAYGFLLWMLNPITLWQLMAERPFVTGVGAMGFFGAHLGYGLLLGLLFPFLHRLVQRELKEMHNGR